MLTRRFVVEALLGLLEDTNRKWCYKKGVIYTEINGGRIDLESIPQRTGPILKFSFKREKDKKIICIVEPPSGGLITKKFSSEEDRYLSDLMHKVYKRAQKNISSQEYVLVEDQETEQEIFKELLFGEVKDSE